MTPHMTLNCTIDYKLTKISIIVEIDREINKRLKKVESCAHLHYLGVSCWNDIPDNIAVTKSLRN